MKKNRQAAGFSLIELLMVFALFSILTLMLMPALHRMRDKGHQATCIGNQRQLAVAALLYANEWRDCLPTSLAGVYQGSYLPDTGNSDMVFENNAYAQQAMSDYYYQNMQLMQCPDSQGDVSYGLNVYIAGWRLDLIENAAKTVLIADSHYDAISSYVDGEEQYLEAVAFRHGATWDEGYGTSIAAYVDGHIEVFQLNDFEILDDDISEEDLTGNDTDSPNAPGTDLNNPSNEDESDDDSNGHTPQRKRYRFREREREREHGNDDDNGQNHNENSDGHDGNGSDDDDSNSQDQDQYGNNDDDDNGCNGNGNDHGNNGLGNGGEESQGEDTPDGEDPSNPTHGDGDHPGNGNSNGNNGNGNGNNDDDDNGCNGNGNDHGNNGLGNGGEESQGEDTPDGEDPSNPAHGDGDHPGNGNSNGNNGNGNGNNK